MLVGIASLFSPVIYTAEAETKPPPAPSVVQIEVREEVPDILLRIADCESGKRDKEGRAIGDSATHYDVNGDVLIGRMNAPEYGVDIGKYQINEVFHGERAEELGLDLYNERDNEAYALMLYEANGTRDWMASSSCWQ